MPQILFFRLRRLTDLWNKQVIQIVERKLSLINNKRDHTPVNQVGTVSLGRIFICNVCPSAKYLLAGSRLLTRRTVSRFYCKIVLPKPTFERLTSENVARMVSITG